MRIKRIILRVSVFLLLFLLVATVLSRTVYRLLLPQVYLVGVRTGTLNTAVSYKTAVGPQLKDASGSTGGGEEEAPPPQFGAELSLSFDELKKIQSTEYRLVGAAELLDGKGTVSVKIALSGYDYDDASGCYTVRFAVTEKDKAIEPGLPLAITVKLAQDEQSMLVPLGSVFPDMSSGQPQYCVFEVVERQTMWGKEKYVQKINVTHNGSDYQNIAITPSSGLLKAVACYPSRPLNDGDAVIVRSAP